jgi:hypothetical protein
MNREKISWLQISDYIISIFWCTISATITVVGSRAGNCAAIIAMGGMITMSGMIIFYWF